MIIIIHIQINKLITFHVTQPTTTHRQYESLLFCSLSRVQNFPGFMRAHKYLIFLLNFHQWIEFHF